MGNSFRFTSRPFQGHVVERNVLCCAAAAICKVGLEGPTKHVAIVSRVWVQSQERLQMERAVRAERHARAARSSPPSPPIAPPNFDKVAEPDSRSAPTPSKLGEQKTGSAVGSRISRSSCSLRPHDWQMAQANEIEPPGSPAFARGPRLKRSGLTVPKQSNQVWTVDFKGWFRTQDGCRVEPLTVRDLFSRYLLGVCLLPDQSWRPVRRIFMRLFARYGYPEIIRMDNGGPFGSSGPAGPSRLSAWWAALGVRSEFIAPGHPEQNGAHEQMHRVYKAETTRPASSHARAQQRRSNRWVSIYNNIRPHEALGQRPPAEFYRPKRLSRPRKVLLRYSPGLMSRQVRSNGQIKWRGRKRFVGEAFVGYPVGLMVVGEDKWEVRFAGLLIGELRESDRGGMRPARHWRRS